MASKEIKSSEGAGENQLDKLTTNESTIDFKVRTIKIQFLKLNVIFTTLPNITVQHHIFLQCRKCFLTVCLHLCSEDGVSLNGSTVQLITHGLLKVNLLIT